MQFDTLITHLRGLSDKGSYDQLVTFIKNNSDKINKYVDRYEELLSTIDISENSIICASLLLALTNSTVHVDIAFNAFYNFVKQFNVLQIMFFQPQFVELCHKVAQLFVEREQPIRGILPMMHAIKKIRKSDTHFTSLHADLCYLCLSAKCFKPALPFLDVNITDINDQADSTNVKQFLLYYYYGGMIYLTQKNIERACFFFEVVIATPSSSLSLIMLEAYKKFIVSSLLAYGKLIVLPKFISNIVNAALKPLAKTYHELATCFTNKNVEDLIRMISTNSAIFIRDANYGLVQQLISASNRINIQKLTKTFLTLKLCDVSNRLGIEDPREAESFILQMVENKEIFAAINQKDSMVLFRDDDDKYNGLNIHDILEKCISNCMDLDRQMVAMDRGEINANPYFTEDSS